jgi:homoserine trans-succinylase
LGIRDCDIRDKGIGMKRDIFEMVHQHYASTMDITSEVSAELREKFNSRKYDLARVKWGVFIEDIDGLDVDAVYRAFDEHDWNEVGRLVCIELQKADDARMEWKPEC